jgi:hypothetical protein
MPELVRKRNLSEIVRRKKNNKSTTKMEEKQAKKIKLNSFDEQPVQWIYLGKKINSKKVIRVCLGRDLWREVFSWVTTDIFWFN